MKRHFPDILSMLTLMLFVVIFFARLFYPEPKLIVTPDFGRSDAWHFSFPTKYALWESLRDYKLPLWRADIGDGFPLLAEGQVGALFFPNLILFRMLDPVQAYNLALMGSIITLALTMYWLGRTLTLSHVPSLFSAITVSFSGLAITNLTHISELQGMSLLPGIIALSILVVRTGWHPWAALLSLAVSQQFFAGFPQSVFITILAASAFVLWETMPTKRYHALLTWIGFVFLGVLASSAQILPSYEFLGEITDPKGFSQSIATAYSMPFKHILSFVSPFAFGNPKYGTYPPFDVFDGSIFWENTAYIGILAVMGAIGSILLKRNKPFVLYLWIIVAGAILLAAGKYSPTYILFSFWPFNVFRVPSRFLWVAVVSLSLLAGLTLEALRTKKILMPITLLHAVLLIQTFWAYHLIEPASMWLQKPTIADRVDGRIITISEGEKYRDAMTTTGWPDARPYRLLKEGVSPDSNMLWGMKQHHVYAGRKLKRPAIVNTLLADTITFGGEQATISSTKFLDMLSVTNILSFRPLDGPDLTRSTLQSDEDTVPILYDNPSVLPRAYLVYEATTAATLEEAVTILRSDIFNPQNTVLLEQYNNVSWTPHMKTPYTITWKRDDHLALDLLVETPKEALLVLTDTYYPGWQARVDGSRTKIYAANLTQRAVKVPKGAHMVTFTYQPPSFSWGMRITVLCYAIIAFLMAVPRLFFAAHTRKTPLPHGQRP